MELHELPFLNKYTRFVITNCKSIPIVLIQKVNICLIYQKFNIYKTSYIMHSRWQNLIQYFCCLYGSFYPKMSTRPESTKTTTTFASCSILVAGKWKHRPTECRPYRHS